MEKQDFNNPQNHTNTQSSATQGRPGDMTHGSQPNKTGSTGTQAQANSGTNSNTGSSKNR